MRPQLPYLTTSPTGWFEYRRGVPKHLRPFFPLTKTGNLKSEWKCSLKTKSATVAQELWVKENRQFEKFLSAAEYLHGNSSSASTTDAIAAANQMAINYGVHPDQAPKLDYKATKAEIDDPVRRVVWCFSSCHASHLVLTEF